MRNQEKQREENKEEYEAEFKKQRTKEEKKARAQADPVQHRRGSSGGVQGSALPLPAELTFVVRAFSVLDGIGKSLNKKFDIGEISAPYARNLLIEDNPSSLPPQVVARQRDFQRRFDRQNKAIVNLFKGPGCHR